MEHKKKQMQYWYKPWREMVDDNSKSCVNTDHKMKSTMRMGILVVSVIACRVLTLFQCERNPMSRLVIMVVGISKPCVETKHEMNSEMKLEILVVSNRPELLNGR